MGATQSTEHPHELETPHGKLRGIEQRDSSGKTICYRYLKVPYALPPVDSLRWRRPQPLPSDFSFNSSSGSPGDYTKFGPICPQPHYTHDLALVDNPSAAAPIENAQSEDCLYLNIWVPPGSPPSGGWPVDFYIHGGWLQVGDANQDHIHDVTNTLAHSAPRIITSVTYRLNLFGFLAGSDLASLKEDPAPANYGFWDQRCALEWVAKNISLFRGNPSNISVGGLSAGANSTFFQLYYDTQLPESQRLIKRIYLRSNAVAIQPRSSTSDELTAQFNELCALHSVPSTDSPSAKLAALRAISSSDLVSSISKLKMHTFRASTDSSFIPPTFLSSLHSGKFTTQLAQHNISVLFGEVCDEAELYKLVNPPSNHAELVEQLANYYPKHVVDALLPLYPVPDSKTGSAEDFANVFCTIAADNQVHTSIRGLTHLLLNPPKGQGIQALPAKNVHRYRIEWRAKNLDKWLKPEVGVCHGADSPIWWCSGWRAGYTESDQEKARAWLKPFEEFLAGKDVSWGREESSDGEKAEKRMRVIDKNGETKEDVLDERWDRGLEVFNAVWQAQKNLVE